MEWFFEYLALIGDEDPQRLHHNLRELVDVQGMQMLRLSMFSRFHLFH
jgi:hypothetical protein